MSVTVMIAGCGYLGQTLALQLLNDSHRVIGVKRHTLQHPDLQADDDFTFMLADIANLRLQDIEPADIAVYCPSPDTADIASYQTTYLTNAKHMLSLCYQAQKKPTFIYLSSTGVYHTNDGSWVDENTHCDPTDARYQAIIQAEHILTKAYHRTIIVRSSGIYGPNRYPLLQALLKQQSHVCHRTRYSNRVHVTDLARAIYHIMHLKQPDALYVVSDTSPTPINHIIAWLSTTLGKAIPEARVDHSEDQNDHKTNKRVSSQRLIETGFHFEYPSYKQGFKSILHDMGLIHIDE